MVRVCDLEASLAFFRDSLGLIETRRKDCPAGRFTLVYLGAPENPEAEVELTFNYDTEDYGSARNFGHLAFAVADLYSTCAPLQARGITINRPPPVGRLAFVRSPDPLPTKPLQKAN